MSNKINGGCLCGAVRYSATGDPAITSICHCRDCQKQSGSAFVEVVAVPNDAFYIEGERTIFGNTADSGRKLTRQFCPKCGSVVFLEAEAFAGMTLIMAGTLDDTKWIKPTMALFCDSAQPWALPVSKDMTSFAGMPI
jgi:hypothetical protein